MHIEKYSASKNYFIASQDWFSFVLTITRLYVQLQQVFLFINNLRILSFNQVIFSRCAIKILKHFSLQRHLPTSHTNNATILLHIPTGKEPRYLEYLIDIILNIVSQQTYPAHYQPKNSEWTVQPWIRLSTTRDKHCRGFPYREQAYLYFGGVRLILRSR